MPSIWRKSSRRGVSTASHDEGNAEIPIALAARPQRNIPRVPSLEAFQRRPGDSWPTPAIGRHRKPFTRRAARLRLNIQERTGAIAPPGRGALDGRSRREPSISANASLQTNGHSPSMAASGGKRKSHDLSTSAMGGDNRTQAVQQTIR